MNEIGHNQPPDMTATAEELTRSLSEWMAENPVIEDEIQAQAAKVFIDRGALCVQDLEDERRAKKKPFAEEAKKIDDHYRSPRELLESVTAALQERITVFLRGEKAKRERLAAEAAERAKALEEAARQAEQREREAHSEASAGVIGHDLATVTANADAAFADYEKAERAAALAERETNVKIGGGFRRSLSLRQKETIIVDDPVAVIKCIGLGNETITEAIVKAARAYRKVMGKYPDGIRTILEEVV